MRDERTAQDGEPVGVCEKCRRDICKKDDREVLKDIRNGIALADDERGSRKPGEWHDEPTVIDARDDLQGSTTTLEIGCECDDIYREHGNERGERESAAVPYANTIFEPAFARDADARGNRLHHGEHRDDEQHEPCESVDGRRSDDRKRRDRGRVVIRCARYDPGTEPFENSPDRNGNGALAFHGSAHRTGFERLPSIRTTPMAPRSGAI